MPDNTFLSKLQSAYAELLRDYAGGLSNTSIGKFKGIRELFAEHLSISERDDVYAIGAGTRPGNIEVRLSQGTRAFAHTKLGLAFVKADNEDRVASLSTSAVVTIKGFLERGKAVYDSIVVLIEVNGRIFPTRLISYPDSSILKELSQIFEGLDKFEVEMLPERSQESGNAVEIATDAVSADKERWIIPDDPSIADFTFPRQRLIEGSPGSGKSYRLAVDAMAADRVIRTVFHPESGFSDFVGYLAPETAFRIEEPAATYDKQLPGIPTVFYRLSIGPLLEAYILAVLNPSHRILLVIEELSRAPAALVFGDIIQLLDRVQAGENSKGLPPEGYSRYEIRPRSEVKTLLETLDATPDFTQSGCMRFPPNLYVWATMNRADQNAKQLDTAFLRRWKREHISHDSVGAYDSALLRMGGDDVKWGGFRLWLNTALVNAGMREDKLIGPYFLPPNALASPEQVADDLLAYVWYDVLRERGENVFPGIKTFADLRTKWISGEISVITSVS